MISGTSPHVTLSKDRLGECQSSFSTSLWLKVLFGCYQFCFCYNFSIVFNFYTQPRHLLRHVNFHIVLRSRAFLSRLELWLMLSTFWRILNLTARAEGLFAGWNSALFQDDLRYSRVSSFGNAAPSSAIWYCKLWSRTWILMRRCSC